MTDHAETVRRVAAAAKENYIPEFRELCVPVVAVARALEAAARCGKCGGNRPPSIRVDTCAVCHGTGIDLARLAAGLAALVEGKP